MVIDRDDLLVMCTKIMHVTKFGMDGAALFTGTDFVGYNQKMLVAIPFETDFSGSFSIRELVIILKKMNPGEIKLYQKNNHVLAESDDLWVSLPLCDSDYRLDIIKALLKMADTHDEWYEFSDASQFSQALALCGQNSSKQGYRSFNCVHLNKHQIIGADDFRIARYISEAYFEPHVLLDRWQCKAITDYTLTQYACTEKYMMFVCIDNSLIVAHNYQNSFPLIDVDEFFDFEGKEYTLPQDLGDHIDRIRAMAITKNSLDQTMLMTLEKNSIILRTEKKNIGISEVYCDAPDLNISKKIALLINPSFLSEALKTTDCVAKIGEKALLLKRGEYSNLISLYYV